MTQGLTIAYITSREDSRIEWFFDSLAKQVVLQNHVIVIDRFAETGSAVWKFCQAFMQPLKVEYEKGNPLDRWLTVSHPKPNVWSGPHRLTKEDWFSVASARNTAICLCETSHIAFVDDLSVLLPGWWNAAQDAISGNYIACGAYKKVKNLVVENGIPISFEESESGMDDRLRRVDKDVSECDGGWLYGCSLVAPLEAFLEINGWPEDLCDGTGAEDYCAGIAIKNCGYSLRYDRRMMTLESEELHFVEKPMKRSDYGVSPKDKSHRCLEIALQSKRFENSFGEGGIRALRERVLAGEPFPIQANPQHEWFTGIPLSEL